MDKKYKHPLYDFIVKKQNSNNTTKHVSIYKIIVNLTPQPSTMFKLLNTSYARKLIKNIKKHRLL